MKKFTCHIIQKDGPEETRIFEAKNKKALEQQLTEQGISVISIREEFSITGNLVTFSILGLLLVPFAMISAEAFIITGWFSFGGLFWVISLLGRSPRKAVGPAVVTLILFVSMSVIFTHAHNSRDRMAPEGKMIIKALDEYRASSGRYPETLEELVSEYLERVPDEPFSYRYYRSTFSDDDYGLSTYIAPFRFIYDKKSDLWYPKTPS